MIEKLKDIEKNLLPSLLKIPEVWNTLDVDYFPPRVERLWTKIDEEYRLFIHIIHPTDEKCLFHKHRWPAAFKMVSGSYEMGISYCETEVSSNEAYKLNPVAKFIVNTGSYYEMVNTHTLHYVKPIDGISISLMLTGPLYPEDEFRKEVLDRKLESLSDLRKSQIITNLLYFYR